MEKVTYPPLIDHLSENSSYYNGLCREFELKHGRLDSLLLSKWISLCIQPILIEAESLQPGQLPVIFRAFFQELLRIMGNQLAILYESRYLSAWSLCKKTPLLIAQQPTRLLTAIDSAIESVQSFQPDQVDRWIDLMENSVSSLTTFKEFLALGRIYAWFCGLAHLRERAVTEFSELRSELKESLASCCPPGLQVEQTFLDTWPNLLSPQFMGECGGFTGFGGYFTSPPKVALIGKQFFAADKKCSCALFADIFGKVLLPEAPVTAEQIEQSSTTIGFKQVLGRYGPKLVTFDDVTSFAVKNNTMVLTRASSHYLYIYGQPEK